jgi:two-component system copper resistance phosphate regulon response regulator CusR
MTLMSSSRHVRNRRGAVGSEDSAGSIESALPRDAISSHGLQRKMKILIVEDEAKTSEYLQQGLAEAGFVVDVARNGMDGHHLAMTESYDLLILDVMLPDIDGWRILKSLRESGNETPVLFLTARDSIDDRVKGLDLGADDYLVKPFAFAELLARVRTLLRRSAATAIETTLTVADLELDLMRRRATRGGQRIPLTAKEFALLELLIRHQSEVLPRSLIASQVWDMNFDSDTNVIDVAIRRLRAKIDEPFEPKLIHTVRGMGYMLDASEDV